MEGVAVVLVKPSAVSLQVQLSKLLLSSLPPEKFHPFYSTLSGEAPSEDDDGTEDALTPEFRELLKTVTRIIFIQRILRHKFEATIGALYSRHQSL